MDPKSFAYWLQGFVELNGGAMPTEIQWKIIKDHLNLVFEKRTPVEFVPPLNQKDIPFFGSLTHPYKPEEVPHFPKITCENKKPNLYC